MREPDGAWNCGKHQFNTERITPEEIRFQRNLTERLVGVEYTVKLLKS